MAAKQPPFRNTFTTSARAQKEARDRLREGIEERARSSILLSPDETAGDYDMSRALVTSLGGKGLRPITIDDLKTFRANVKRLGERFKGGITAKQVIDLSMPGPRQRAHQQITTAIPMASRGSRVQFQTNAGPGSKHTRHMVVVEFMNFDACVASPIPSLKIAPELLKGKIKLDCGCEDWRYRLRYLATAGRYAAGPWFEQSFPKMTNPMLLGVACKHVLRVMTLVTQSPTFKNYAARMIDQARVGVERKAKAVKVTEMEDFAKQLKKESWRQRSIRTSEEKRAARQKTTVAALRTQAQAKARQKEQAKAAKDKNTALKGLEANARKLLALKVINQQQFDAMLAAAGK